MIPAAAFTGLPEKTPGTDGFLSAAGKPRHLKFLALHSLHSPPFPPPVFLLLIFAIQSE